eukprot:scaffold1488_cov141-Amphora_coffeaeformis.AAC.16
MRRTIVGTVQGRRPMMRLMPSRGCCRRSIATAPSSSPDDPSFSSTPRSRLLQSALEHVPEHGWTSQAILAAVRLNHPDVSLSYATTLQATDLVQCFMETCNQKLREQLRQERQEQSDDDTTTTTTLHSSSRVERFHHAMRLRLEMVANYIAMGRWHQGMALGISQPEAALTTSEQLKDIITVIVQETATTDDDNDQNSQPPLSDLAQLSLGAVYVATECHMLSDTSVDYQDTWDFLRQTLQQWDSLLQRQQSNSLLSSSCPADAAFLASTLATAFGHGLMSVSNVTLPTAAGLPTPDQMWHGAMSTITAFTGSSTPKTMTTTTTTSTNPGTGPKGTSSV